MFITRFATTIWTASTDAHSYVAQFIKRRTGQGMGYLYAVVTTLSFITILPIAIAFFALAPMSDTFVAKHAGVLRAWYPDDLVVTVSGGVLSTNRNQPVMLAFPAEWLAINNSVSHKHAIVIDVRATADDFERYDTFVLFTQRSAIVRDDKSIRIYSFEDFDESLVVNEELIAEITDGVTSFAPSLPWIIGALALAFLVVLPWIAGGIAWLANLFFLTWATGVLWLVSSIMGRTLRYGELYRLGLYGITSSLLASFVLGMVSVGPWWVSWVLFFCWMSYVIAQFPKRAGGKKAVILPPASEKPTTTKAIAKKPVAKKPRKKAA